MKNIAIFASGTGTNAENIIKYFSTRNSAKVVLVLSNRREAGVLKRAEALGVNTYFFDRNDFYVSGSVLKHLLQSRIDFIVLAGFLWLVPDNIIKCFEGRLINIHPALLPAYGGKGMYGDRVHRAVIENKDRESGITIHYVNNNYDEGDIVFQAKCKVGQSDTPESLASRIHALEYKYFPEIIEKLILEME
ncbi:MAG TPA: phosphoribosylglycinamide formyltransferase [Bacteroidales bacterium]|jgi:phosphoribosylglycinamide formyltransferase-1|nr:phosphoribosylglycinamide formyltransferase [Bacteroidales bacterium]HOX74887.1 phosphoribosylglycinamide formyltransferase [Bacteroidales bacterium]HPM87575.1 phosphoribosylglycinamide formyltransferase [Bacteroidales bacterium]HQM68466.1 phosphoribosylglycinamide formyltransferase [Bacteroidales bacterium]